MLFVLDFAYELFYASVIEEFSVDEMCGCRTHVYNVLQELVIFIESILISIIQTGPKK